MTIDLDPHAFGVTLLPWTTLLSIAGATGAIAWMMYRASTFGITARATYATALRTVLWSLLGGRLFHLIDYAGFYVEVPFQAFYLWNGGLSLWGALIFGAGGALWHAKRARAVIPAFGEALTLAGLAVLALGRFGDLLAGERLGTASSLPWAVTYAHQGSASFGIGPAHPVALYEALVALAILAVLILYRQRITTGRAIHLGFAGLALGRFLIGFATAERTALGLDSAQWIALVILAVVGLIAFRRKGRSYTLITHNPTDSDQSGDSR